MAARVVFVRGLGLVAIASSTCLTPTHLLIAQPPQSALVPYRAPEIALVQPQPDGVVTQDHPMVLLRYAPGDPSDALDVGTFIVTINGAERTHHFQVTASEAWGPLAIPDNDTTTVLPPGAYQLWARICSTRGACATTTAAVMVAESPVKPDSSQKSSQRPLKRKLLDALLSFTRSLLSPR